MSLFKQLQTFLAFLALLYLLPLNTKAQGTRGNDTTYYVYFPGSITTRLYASEKYLHFTLKSKEGRDLHYLPNTRLNYGLGFTYHNFSVNFAYSFPQVRNESDIKVKAKHVDLQIHSYKPKWVTDLYCQLYKGYYLSNQDIPAPPGFAYYYRPDMKVDLFGLSRYRIFNPKRFSYRASFVQSEWQKKSAGSLFAGAEAYYGVFNGDSNLVPKSKEAGFTQSGIDKISYFSIGPGGGYAYTLVLAQHFFITGSLTGNLNFSNATENAGGIKHNYISANSLFTVRSAVGYNSRSWDVSGTWVMHSIPFTGNNSNSDYLLNGGNYRIIIAKRFMPGRRLHKSLRMLDKIFKE